MKKVLVFCVLLVLALSLDGSSVWAIDIGWMQPGVRIWYYGGGGSGDAEEAYLITAINGDSVQVRKHSASSHWTLGNQTATATYHFLGDPQLPDGPCWIHPQTLQSLARGDGWRQTDLFIDTVYRHDYTYDTLPAELLHLLPAKALFDVKAQRQLIKITYTIPPDLSGMAYFDAETGLLLLDTQTESGGTIFFVLSEINYDFANQQAFAEDNGPHSGFLSFVMEEAVSMSFVMNEVTIQSLVESRYGDTVEAYVSTSLCPPCVNPPLENYCFFGSIPILRYMNHTEAPNYPPDQWNPYGLYLWWWIPTGALQNAAINVFDVPMTRTSTSPYTFTATQQPAGFYFSKLWFDNDGYMTKFSAKNPSAGLDLDAENNYYFNPQTRIDGLSYYKNTMGIATPVQTSPLYGNFAGYGVWEWNGTAWSQLSGINPTNIVASGSLYVYGVPGYAGVWKWDGSAWSQLNQYDPTVMVTSSSALYVKGVSVAPGVWKWDGTAWSQLSGIDPTNMVASGSLYVSGVPGHPGVWKWNGSAWSQLNQTNPTNMVASGPILYVSGVPGHPGVWKWDGTAWSQLNQYDPTGMVASSSALYVKGVSVAPGVWKWDGAAWSQLNQFDPTYMAASDSTLYVSGVPGYPGVWKWNGSAWSQLNTINSVSMVAN